MLCKRTFQQIPAVNPILIHVVRGREVQGAFAGLQVRQDLWDRQGLPELREIPVQMELRGQQGRGEQQVLQEIPEPPASQGLQGQLVKMALPDRRVQQDLPEVPDHRD